METKRVIYITAFTILGLMLGFVAHLLVELAVFTAIDRNWHYITLGLTRSDWIDVRYIAFGLWLAFGLIFGFRQGIYWWDYLYGHDVVVEPRVAKRKRGAIFVILVILTALWYFTRGE